MHDQILSLIGALMPLSDPTGSDTGSTAIKTAIIAGIALVLAALLPSVVGHKEREPKAVRELRITEQRLRDELTKDRDEWKKTAEAAVRGTELRDAEIDRLRRLCMSANPPINPFIPHTAEGQADD